MKINKIINKIIIEYINDRHMRAWLENNMVYYRNRLKNDATPKQAFAYVIQSPLSMYNAKMSDYDTITNTLWQALEKKNHSLTRLW